MWFEPYEDFGNSNYGATAAVMGIPESEAQRWAGCSKPVVAEPFYFLLLAVLFLFPGGDEFHNPTLGKSSKQN